MNATPRPSRAAFWITLLFGLGVLIPAVRGFGQKFYELCMLIDDADGAFAVMPVVNYLLASIGFLLLLGWAILNGMFRDIEKPKYTMLQTEQMLDECEAHNQRAEEDDHAATPN